MAIFPLAVIVLVFPSALPGGNFSTGQALLVALISAAMYGVFPGDPDQNPPEPVRVRA